MSSIYPRKTIKRKTRTPGIPLEVILDYQGLFNKNRRFGVYFSRRQLLQKAIRQVITAGLSPA